MEKIKVWSDVIATWVTIIGVFVGGIFGLFQYSDKLSSERVKETLEYVDRYSTDSLWKARSGLDDFWNPRAEEVFAIQKMGERELFTFLDSTIRKNSLESDVNLLVSFFENLRACTCAELCDETTVRRFFGKDAYDLHGLVFPYISEQRRRLNDKSFGKSLELLAKNYDRNGKSSFNNAYCSANPVVERDAP